MVGVYGEDTYHYTTALAPKRLADVFHSLEYIKCKSRLGLEIPMIRDQPETSSASEIQIIPWKVSVKQI